MVPQPAPVVPEFWRIDTVTQVIGLSRSEIYKQVALGHFPASRAYRQHPKRRYWLSVEVQRWQASQVGEDEWAALLG